MNRKRREISIGLAGKRFREGLHICYIFRDEDERQRTIANYIRSGLKAGEKVCCAVDTLSPDDFMESMAALGCEGPALKRDLVVYEALPFYFHDGHFSGSKTVELIAKFYADALRDGYVGSRIAGEINWAMMEGLARKKELMEYEAQVNRLLLTVPCTACCQYDARKYDGATLMDVLSVHPMMIVRGQLVENPYFVPPGEFMSQLNRRQPNGQMNIDEAS